MSNMSFNLANITCCTCTWRNFDWLVKSGPAKVSSHFHRRAPMSSNLLKISFVCKKLVASCVCVAGVQSSFFNAFISSANSVHLQQNKRICLYLVGGLETLSKRANTSEKSFCKTFFHLGMGLKKDRNKAEIKESKKTTLHLLCIFCESQVVFFLSFNSALFLYFFRSTPKWNVVLQKIPSQFMWGLGKVRLS